MKIYQIRSKLYFFEKNFTIKMIQLVFVLHGLLSVHF